MTTIPGHNIVIQQSGSAHDALHHVKHGQPDPQNLAGQQVLRENAEQTTVRSSEGSEQLKSNKKKLGKNTKKAEDKKKQKKQKRAQYPDVAGNLFDTIV